MGVAARPFIGLVWFDKMITRPEPTGESNISKPGSERRN
jgi:hypothetical protein